MRSATSRPPSARPRKKLVDDYYKNNDCATYTDYRELIARKDIDVVLIATCDHWHVLVALEAARAGKDIYLEKPMGLSLAEDQALRAACRQYGTRFQFGTQQRSEPGLPLRLRAGAATSASASSRRSTSGRPAALPAGREMSAQPPAWIDYNMWLGPAPYHAYTPGRESNSWWWFISDYALGFIAGWGVHPLDIALWGLGDKVPCPLEIEGKGAVARPRTASATPP